MPEFIENILIGVRQWVNAKLDSKQDTLTPGQNIVITNNTISAVIDAGFQVEVVQTLPESGEANTIYFVPKAGGANPDVYDEYMYINNAWEKIGSTEVDLSNYYNKTEVDGLLADKQDKLTAGNNITINGTTISANDTTYSAGDNIDITDNAIKAVGYRYNTTNGAFAEGDRDVVEGETTFIKSTATGLMSHAEGSNTKANGRSSHAEGQETIASGYYSHSEGYKSKAQKGTCHAEGNNTTASGDAAHAEGYSTTASGKFAHAEGSSTQATGDSAHAEGIYAIAIGGSSHAEGSSTKANGNNSHAEGAHTVTNGSNTHAEGRFTKTLCNAEHAQGSYNVSHKATDNFDSNAGNTIHSIGIGTAEDARKNAVEVMQNGDAYLLGVGGYDGVHIKGETGAPSGLKTLQETVNGKQDVLTAGDNILINNNIISATGTAATVTVGTTTTGESGTNASVTNSGTSSAAVLDFTIPRGNTGADGISATHSWNGTTLTITSASGTSSADLKGAPGINGINGTNGADGLSIYVVTPDEKKNLENALSSIGYTIEAVVFLINFADEEQHNLEDSEVVGSWYSNCSFNEGDQFILDGYLFKILSFDGNYAEELCYQNLIGPTGSNGTSAYWFSGTAVTGTRTNIVVSVPGSKAGDMYLNTNTYNVYKATAANTWNYTCNIQGILGNAGTIICTGNTFNDDTIDTVDYNGELKIGDLVIDGGVDVPERKGNIYSVSSKSEGVYLVFFTGINIMGPSQGGADTKNTAGATNNTSKLYLIGSPDQSTNPLTYSNSSVYETNGTLHANKLEIGGGTASGTNAVVEGENNLASGNYSHVEGYSNKCSGYTAHVEGSYNCNFHSSQGHVEGYLNTAHNERCHVEGSRNAASGLDAHAEGYQDKVISFECEVTYVSEGDIIAIPVIPLSEISQSFGFYDKYYLSNGTSVSINGLVVRTSDVTFSVPDSSVALPSVGDYIVIVNTSRGARGAYSHCEGYQTAALGQASHAGGEGTIASGANQTAIGKYNVSDSTSLFIVGNGTSSNRSNAFTVIDGSSNNQDSALATVNGILNIYLGCPIGTIVMWPGTTCPRNWAWCNGDSVPICAKTLHYTGRTIKKYCWIQVPGGKKYCTNVKLNLQASLDNFESYIYLIDVIGDAYTYSNTCIYNNIKYLYGISDTTIGTTVASESTLYLLILNIFSNDNVKIYLPNLQQRFPLGAGIEALYYQMTAGGITYDTTLGSKAGSKEVTLTKSQIPAHNHSMNFLDPELKTSSPSRVAEGTGDVTDPYNYPTRSNWERNGVAGRLDNVNKLYTNNDCSESLPIINNTGGDGAHTNMPPYIAINFIIKYQ